MTGPAASWTTADLSDENPDLNAISTTAFRAWGLRRRFSGQASTVRCPDDNSRVKEAVAEPGRGRVLVIDGSLRTDCSLVGDQIALLASNNGWAGFIVAGCVRDSAVIDTIDIGLLAIGTVPRKTQKRGLGERDLPVNIQGVIIKPGDYVYIDGDGILVSPRPLLS